MHAEIFDGGERLKDELVRGICSGRRAFVRKLCSTSCGGHDDQQRGTPAPADFSDDDDGDVCDASLRRSRDAMRKTLHPLLSIPEPTVGVPARALTLEAELYALLSSIPESTSDISVNTLVSRPAGASLPSQTHLAYRHSVAAMPAIPIPIFARYANKESGCVEKYMTKGVYIRFDEETAMPDVQLWRMAVTHVLKHSQLFVSALWEVFGSAVSLNDTAAQWLLVKIICDCGLHLASRISGPASVPLLDHDAFLPSALRSLTLTLCGILQGGEKPLGSAWECCKNTKIRPHVLEDHRDWHTLLVLCKLYPKTGLDWTMFVRNVRVMLVRFFCRIVDPFLQALHKVGRFFTNNHEQHVHHRPARLSHVGSITPR